MSDPNYADMSSADLIEVLGDDGYKWGVAFCQMAEKLGYGKLDEGWVIGWFANAIERACQKRRLGPNPRYERHNTHLCTGR